MFENVIQDTNNGPKKLNNLLAKYTELRQFLDLYKITKDRKSLNKKRQRVLKQITTDLRSVQKPEETYEIWHQHSNLNANLAKQKISQPLGEFIKTLDLEELQDRNATADVVDYRDDHDEQDDNLVIHQLKTFAKSFDNTDNLLKSQFAVVTSGLELFPNSHKHSFLKNHVKSLTTVLYINLLRKNWNLAYKAFCLLIKFPIVDLRSLWPLGIEILRSISLSSPNSFIQDEKFFEWLSSYYVINHINSAGRTGPSRLIGAPIWRTGSKTLPPMYVIASLWDLLAKNEYRKLQSKLEELMLQPPYDSDGLMYFLSALCKLGLGIESTNPNANTSIDLFKILKTVETYLKKARSLGFFYPKDLVSRQLSIIRNYIGVDFSDTSSSESDPGADTDEDRDEEKPVEHQLKNDNDDDVYEELSELEEYDEKSNDRATEDETLVEEEGHKRAPETLDFDFDFN